MSGGTPPPRPAPARPPLARPALPMDTRIRARRIAVVREEGRRRLRVLFGVAAVVSLGGVAAALSRSPLLDVDHVRVLGAERTAPAAVVRAGGLADQPLMVSVDTGAVSRRVEALPWVLDARAERRWPGTVRIEVTEREPAAVVPVDGGRRWALVDATGQVLAVEGERPPGLPALGGVSVPGPPGRRLGPAARAALQVVTSLPATLAARVADVAATPTGVELALTGPGAVVRLGEATELPAKLAALTALLARDGGPGMRGDPVPGGGVFADVAVIDVRVPSAPVLTRR